MPTPRIASLCDEIVTYLRNDGITEAERRWNPYLEAEQLGDRRVFVVPRNTAIEPASQRGNDYEWEIHIHITQRVDNTVNDQVDNLDAVSDQITDLWDQDGALRDQELNVIWEVDEQEGEVISRVGALPIGAPEFADDQKYDVAALRDDSLYRSVIIVRYRKD